MAAPTAQRAPAGAQEVTGSWGRVAFLSDWGAGVGGGRWSGAAVLAEYVCGAPGHALAGRRRGPGSLAGARVLELGSGTGLCGLALAAGGAAAVTVTDVRGAVPLMAANVALNGLGGRVRAEPLEWGVDRVDRASTINLVVMSDVIYAPSLHAALFSTLRDIEDAFPAAAFLMSVEARRREERGFFDMLRAGGWGYRKVPEGLVSAHPSGGLVAVFHLAPRDVWV